MLTFQGGAAIDRGRRQSRPGFGSPRSRRSGTCWSFATTLEPLEAFYEAEEYHQDYAARNPDQPYIVYVAQPKVEKLRENFAERLKR